MLIYLTKKLNEHFEGKIMPTYKENNIGKMFKYDRTWL